MSETTIEQGDMLEAPFWPEAVRVITVQELGGRTKIAAVGMKSQHFYSCILGTADLARIRRATGIGHDFQGRAEAFFLAIEAHRVRFAQQFDPLFAVNASQVDSLPHQIEAVYHNILRSPRIRFLLADDPGAGKTIMTGLLLKELKYRGVVRRTLIVVPGHLKDQWLREMKERFSETFTLVDRNVMNATWGRNIWLEQPQVITSMDFGKQNDVMATLAETSWDLVVVDEAHKMAAYRYGDKTSKTERYRFGELLSRTSQFLLFLTATPHRGDPENFRLFLDLLQPGMFANTDLLLESVQNRDNPLFLRRLKEDLRDFEGRPLFPPRHVFTKPYRLNDDEKRLYNAVTEYVERSYNKALASDKRNVAFALLILQRRLASSVRAVRRSLERRKARLEELLSLGQWLAEGGQLDEDELEDAPETERLRCEDGLVERLTAAETREELQAEIEKLGELIRLARDAERHEVETKLGELRRVMSDEKIQQTGEKILIFTESRETLEYLVEKLKTWGYTVAQLHGGMDLDARIRAEHDFREKTQVMISTEAGGEGINLQFCSLMVNYDLPWNPNRLEQRMGRIHRYGQQKEVHIYNLVAADTREGKVMQALFEKLERIREAYGSDRVFDVIGEVMPGRTLKDLIVEAIAQRRTLEDIIAEIKAVPDEEAVRKAREAAQEALATRHIDLSRILGEERRAREHRLVPEYIEKFFLHSCRFVGLTIEQRRDALWRVPLVPYELRNVPQAFKHQYGEVFHEYSKLAFDKQTARRQEAEFVAPGHPLLETLIERLLADCAEDLRRGAVFADPDGQLDGWLWFLEGELRDGANQIAGKRLFTVYQPRTAAELRLLNSSVLWDLRPADQTEQNDAPDPSEHTVIAFAVEQVLDHYRAELLELRQRDAAIKQKYGLRSLEQMLLDCDAKLIDYETRRTKGEPIPDVELRNEERRREELQARKRALVAEIEHQTSLLPSTPRVLGVVRVIPQPAADAAMRSDAGIEAIGMQVALEYERAQGRVPTDVSRENLGYDIRSEAPDGAVRYIEVKARATTGVLVLTPNEWLMAQRFGVDYYLYVVENAASEPKLFTLQNPAAKLCPEEVKQIVRYVVADWKKTLE
ncbi:MAG: helicase-related protein [Candidatus Sumerlaeia bacterium]|nr:helicase-related protein [Candidatus Sumerlaeia bacterium]